MYARQHARRIPADLPISAPAAGVGVKRDLGKAALNKAKSRGILCCRLYENRSFPDGYPSSPWRGLKGVVCTSVFPSARKCLLFSLRRVPGDESSGNRM